MKDIKAGRDKAQNSHKDHRRNAIVAGLHVPRAPNDLYDRFAVELIGAPGSGKTTLARAVADELERRNVVVRRSISARPAEMAQDGGQVSRSRSSKLLNAVSQLMRGDPVTDALLHLMPLKNRLMSLRRRRYLADLATIKAECGLVVQDQGYLCAIAGLALDSGRVSAHVLAEALDLVAMPDIVVRVSVPDAITETRIKDRIAKQRFAERVLERSPADNGHLDQIYDMMDPILRDRGCQILRVSGADQRDLQTAVATVSQTVLSARPASHYSANLS